MVTNRMSSKGEGSISIDSRMPAVANLGYRHFPGHGIVNAKPGKVLDKPGRVVTS